MKKMICSTGVLMLLASSCMEAVPSKPKPVEIVKAPEKLDSVVNEQIRGLLDVAVRSKGKMDDSIVLSYAGALNDFYQDKQQYRLWGDEKKWRSQADSMWALISRAEEMGLFPNDYHARHLGTLLRKLKDSSAMMDAALWARGELMFSDAILGMAKDLKLGRIPRDSISLNKDSVMRQGFFNSLLDAANSSQSLRDKLTALEPVNPQYLAIRAALPGFLDSLDRTEYTYIDFPKTDSLVFITQLQSRLFESSYITFNTHMADSNELKAAIRKAQTDRGLKIDGKAGPALVGSLNNSGLEKLRRIAINMDRYKQLPDSMPAFFIWVNLPAYTMRVWDSGQVVLESKVIVGQPKTRTPVLNSAVTNFITFPQWTVPYSIIFKEMLPKIQKNVDYLNKENLMVVDQYDSVIDPHTIDWSKLSKTNFPYLLRQRQGDDNSLGVIKFNFRNKYDVYMHDTNARSLFGRSVRSLSHGCVRVQSWDTLARYLLGKDGTSIPVDTLHAWLKRQEKHYVNLKTRVPVFLRYITCEAGEEGNIRFYEDIYGDDKALRNKYFAKKN